MPGSARAAPAQTLCLGDGRFEITASWHNHRTTPVSSGTATAVALSDESGYFWFFRDSNIELLCKVLDGRALTGRHWYFHAPLTDVEFLVEIRDHRTGFRYRYLNPQGSSQVVRDVSAFDDRPLDGRVLLVLAHPDDEGLFAPLLGRLCVERSQACRFLVLTRGENGPCVLDRGCGADLGALRVKEMQASAELFGAELWQWQLPDLLGTPTTVEAGWQAAAGGAEKLAQELRDAITDFEPDLLLVFDPRHGSTCHPAHRASAQLAIAAAEQAAHRPSVYRLTTVARFPEAADGTVSATFSEPSPGDPGVLSYFGDWSLIAAVMARHASQFTPELRAAVLAVPAAQQAVHLVPGGAVAADSSELCQP